MNNTTPKKTTSLNKSTSIQENNQLIVSFNKKDIDSFATQANIENNKLMFKESEPLEVSMEELWRFGIPINLRKTFWPFKIQNLLCISKQLYRLNKE